MLTPGAKYFVVGTHVVHGAFGSTKGTMFSTFCGVLMRSTTPIDQKEIITCLECLMHLPR